MVVVLRVRGRATEAEAYMRSEAGRHCAGAAVRVRQRAGGAYVTPSHWPGDLLPLLLRGAKDEAPTHDASSVRGSPLDLSSAPPRSIA